MNPMTVIGLPRFSLCLLLPCLLAPFCSPFLSPPPSQSLSLAICPLHTSPLHSSPLSNALAALVRVGAGDAGGEWDCYGAARGHSVVGGDCGRGDVVSHIICWQGKERAVRKMGKRESSHDRGRNVLSLSLSLSFAGVPQSGCLSVSPPKIPSLRAKLSPKERT